MFIYLRVYIVKQLRRYDNIIKRVQKGEITAVIGTAFHVFYTAFELFKVLKQKRARRSGNSGEPVEREK